MKNPASKEVFERLCRRIAEIDHEIVFIELDGVKVDGKKIKIKPKEEDIEYRYGLFTEMYEGYSEKALMNEIKKLKLRLKKSDKYRRTKFQKMFKPDKLEFEAPMIFVDEDGNIS
jgi:hypothetical protein